MITCYIVPEIWHMTDENFSLWVIFPQTAQKNENLIKNEKKNSWRYHHIIQIYQKS